MSDYCPRCKQEIRVGDWPYCEPGGGHSSARSRDAKAFDAILLYEMPDGSHFYPGSNDVTHGAPEGGKPIMITNLRQADALVRETNAREQPEIDLRTEAKRNHADRVQRESRAQLKAELEKRGISRRNVDAIIEDRDGRGPGKEETIRQFEAVMRETGQPFDRAAAEKLYDSTQRTRRDPNYRSRPQANFQIEVFSKDSSSREGWRDERTNWKYRKS